jgi:competence protein ComFC
MIKLDGIWKEGYAFDLHTISSVYKGDNQYGHPTFDTVRSTMGQYLYELKYGQHLPVLEKIKQLLIESRELKEFISKIDVIVPVPPSNKYRLIQPVKVCAEKLSEIYGKKLDISMLSSTNKEELKSTPTDEKYDKVRKSIYVANNIDINKKLMVFDDVFDSGSTLTAITSALTERGYENIFIFTLTKTRNAD